MRERADLSGAREKLAIHSWISWRESVCVMVLFIGGAVTDGGRVFVEKHLSWYNAPMFACVTGTPLCSLRRMYDLL